MFSTGENSGHKKALEKAPIGKAAGVDAIKSEMLKIDMETSTNLLFELWAACGRAENFLKHGSGHY